MKKLIAIVSIVSLVGAGCKKQPEYISLSNSDPSAVIFTENGGNPKLFPKFNYVPDGSLTDEYISFHDYTIQTKFDGPIVAPSDLTVTYSIDAAAVAKFNTEGAAADPNFKPYTLLPSNQFQLLVTSDVIKKGEVYAPKVLNNLVTHPNLIDPSQFYLIPIKVTNSAYPSTTASSTIFIYIIGNPLAGGYHDFGVRWSLTGSVAWAGPPANLPLATAPGVPSVNPPTAAPPTFTYNYDEPGVPVDGQTITIDYGNVPDPAGGLAQYFITANAAFSAITFDFSSTFKAGYSNIDKYVRAYVAPSPTQKPAFRLVSKYNNATGGSGSDRLLDESFQHL